ncbi:MAG TPA: histidine kinase [Actinomycetota bacterium]|nr:histidine kinase [Actinomycetota bacterium]
MTAITATLQAPRRRELLRDAALAAGLTLFAVAGTFGAAHGQPTRRPVDGWAILLVVLAGIALAVRRRYPVAVLEFVFGTTLAFFALGYANGPIWILMVVAYVTTVLRGHRLAAAITAVIGFGIFPWLDPLLRDRPDPSIAALVGLAAWLLVLYGAAELLRIRRERAAEAARMREEEALRRASEERLQIARELHDALGHHLSLINVQAGVALHVNEGLPDELRGSLAAIKEASKEGLTELRSVLEILRRDDERAPRSPASTLAKLDDLVAQAGAAGLEVRTETAGHVRPLPFGVDVAAFRVVQEALTNVARHAGPATATVRVTYGQRELSVQVDDDGRGSGSDGSGTPGTGKGVVGMRERVAALGGELEAGPRPGGGFRVRARLPLEDAR